MTGEEEEDVCACAPAVFFLFFLLICTSDDSLAQATLACWSRRSSTSTSATSLPLERKEYTGLPP